MPWLAKGRMNDAMTWLHTAPKEEPAVTPAKAGAQSPEKKK